jgi:hypothetical protein
MLLSVLYDSVLSPLGDPILNGVLIYRATDQVSAFHEAVERDADAQLANIPAALTGTFELLQKLQVCECQNHKYFHNLTGVTAKLVNRHRGGLRRTV